MRSCWPSALRTPARETPTSIRGGGATEQLIVCGCEESGGSRAVALSFDDGPSEWTPAVLDLLGEHDARATFFVVGRYVDGRPELAARAAREGHELGNHTYDHIDCAHEQDDEVVREQILRASDAIARATGAQPRLMRPPYGKDVCRVARLAAELDLSPTVLWTVQAWDWDEPPAAEIVERVLRDSRPGGIILLHDGAPPYDSRSREQTVVAVGRLLPLLVADGYEIVTVSELLTRRAQGSAP